MRRADEERVYTIYVCALCASDDIMSNEEGSYCNECREWMNAEELAVSPTQPKEPAND